MPGRRTVASERDLGAQIEVEAARYLCIATNAVGAAKRKVRSLGLPITNAIIDQFIPALADTREGDEATEGIAAFLDKRKPVWDTSA